MSQQTREWVINHPHTFFQAQSQRDDILNQNGLRTQAVAHIQYLLEHGFIIEFTAIWSDHHNDLALNATPPNCGTHEGRWAYDCWPLASPSPGDYLDPADPRFQAFLEAGAQAPFYMQCGLGGSAYTPQNIVAAGSKVFEDDGADHVHFGCLA